MYADDLRLISPTVCGLQNMLDMCSQFGNTHDMIFNPQKTVCVAVNDARTNRVTMYLNNQPIPWVDSFKYLGITFKAKNFHTVDTAYLKRNFYAACNSILARDKYTSEIVQVQLIKSYCLPILLYCIGALELNNVLVHELSVCWNDAFRKIFHYNRWESLKQVQYLVEL